MRTKRTHREEDEGLVKDKGKEILEEMGDLVLESGEQDKLEKTTKPRLVEPYRPPIPSLKGLSRPNLRLSWEISIGTQEITNQYPILRCHLRDAFLC